MKDEGIVLKSTPFKEGDVILSVFMQHTGLLSLFVKHARRHTALVSPFCQTEFVYSKGTSDLYRFQDGSVIDTHFFLRDTLKSLNGAAEMAKIILHSQLFEKPTPQLYALFSSFLKQLPHFETLDTLLTCFRLKVLTHEGIISWSNPPVLPEWNILKELVACRSFQKMKEISLPEGLSLKIQNEVKNFL